MTEFFEVHERDGAARLGELRLAEPVPTPALVDDHLADAGSLWSEERELPDGSESELTVLPHRGFPAGTEPEVQDSFRPAYPDVDYPSAAVVAPESAADLGQDAYVLSNAQGIVGHAAAFVEAIVETREAVPEDAALYLPGVATPGNVATLAYAGVDCFDEDRAVIAGTQGRYLGTDGERDLATLRGEDEDGRHGHGHRGVDALPCACPACAGTPPAEFDREDCVEHNVNALRAEVARVRSRIREGTLRDYLEGQARHEQWHTATFRRLDRQWSYLEQRTPLVRTAEITAASDDTLRRVEIQRYADRVTSRFVPRLDDHPLVLVPCSAYKPYSDSQSHEQFHQAIQFRGHVVSITSPIGVVPAELELTYPAQHYDAVVTGDWSATEVEFVADVLSSYLDGADYPRVVAHLPEDYRPIVERATADRDVDVEYTVADHPTTGDSLSNLAGALEGELKYSRAKRYRSIVRGIADYAIGEGAGDAVFDAVEVHGRYPRLQVDAVERTGEAAGTDGDAGGEAGGPEPGEQLAAVVPQYGTLSFTLAGARRWVDSGAPVKRVAIDDFVPKGSVLAPGVVDADDEIRVGDEVIVEGPNAFGVGRAGMAGPEMAESTRGVAVDVRHVEET